MNLIKKYLVLALVSFVAVSADATVDITGNYSCKGYDPYADVKYIGPVTIKKTSTNTYSMSWKLGEDQSYIGTGLLNENRTTLAAFFYIADDVNTAGIEVYQIQPNGSLQGTWVMNNSTKVGIEDCTKQ